MPTYCYRRDDGTTFDVFQRITDPALTTDPETGRPVERVISGGAGLQFKGSGFYLTDYVKKSGGESTGGSETKAPKDGGSTDAGSKDGGSKPAASSTSDAKPAAPSAPPSTPSKG